MSLDRPAVGDRVQFIADQFNGVGFLFAILEVPGNTDPRAAMASIGVLDYPQALTLPLSNCRTIERGALQRSIVTPAEVANVSRLRPN